MRYWALVGICLGVMVTARAEAADSLARIDAARALLTKGDTARALHELDLAVIELQDRLGKSLAETLPPALPGWKTDAVEVQSLSQAGGGLSLTRGYEKGDASLNASLILDSPQAQSVGSATQPGQKKIKINNEDALVRYDSQSRNGEVLILLSGRAVLEVTGDNLPNGDALTDLAKGWNLARIKAVLTP